VSYEHYEKKIGGAKADVYRVLDAYGFSNFAIMQSIKKLIRFGTAHKGKVQDVTEARDGLNRWLEMQNEDKNEGVILTAEQYADIEAG